MATKHLINGSGVMIKPKNKFHMLELLNKGGGWVSDPASGEPVQKAGGFRVAKPEEEAEHLAKWAKGAKRMQQLELQAKKQNAQLVMMAPDEATLEAIIERREAAREASGKSKKKADKEAE